MSPQSKSPEHARALAEEIARRLVSHGFQALFNGGCVRDLLLGRAPADYDVSTDARPDQIAEIFPSSVMVGARFGVVLVVGDDAQVEVATFRCDIGYSDGRHPDSVEFSNSAQEDVQRRDFTINGMMLDPRTGEVLDYVGGREDLAAGIIRAIGDPARRINEDKLRMLRGLRFAARFGYQIEPKTFSAIQAFAPSVNQVSAERLRDELTKILTEGAARRGFELLDESGLLRHLLPEITRMHGVQQPPEFHPEGDVWIHTLLVLDKLQPGSSATLAWGALLHDVGKPTAFRAASETSDRIRFDRHVEIGVRIAEDICRRFRFSNAETEQVSSLVANHMRFKDVPQMRESTLKRFARLPLFDEHLELHRIDCLSAHGMLDNWEFMRRFIAETPPEKVRPERLITGDDLLNMGFLPGPEFKTVLAAVEDAQLEGKFSSKAEALEYAKTLFIHRS